MKYNFWKAYQSVPYEHRRISQTNRSFWLNLWIGVGKLGLGIYFMSVWWMITASYYIALSIARGYLLYVNNKYPNRHITTTYVIGSSILVCLGIIYFILCVWMYSFHERITYPYYILYGVVAIAFYKIGVAVYDLCKHKNDENPLAPMIKTINLFDACVSIVSIQCAILISQQASNASSSSALLGAFVSVIFIGIAIFTFFHFMQKKRILQE